MGYHLLSEVVCALGGRRSEPPTWQPGRHGRDEGNDYAKTQSRDCVRIVHLQQNAQAYVPRHDLKAEVAADLRAIFTATDKPAAVVLLNAMVGKYEKTASKLATWLPENVLEGLTVLGLPAEQRRGVRTTNGLERVNRELKRRTRVIGIFPNEAK